MTKNEQSVWTIEKRVGLDTANCIVQRTILHALVDRYACGLKELRPADLCGRALVLYQDALKRLELQQHGSVNVD